MSANNSSDAVRALAYKLWQERGGSGGSPEDDWCRAEEILREDQRASVQDSALQQVAGNTAGEQPKSAADVDRAVEESFPASDPPAVHVTDEPPVNANAKWRAAKNAQRKDKGKGARA